MELTFDRAIELLEITDIAKVSVEDLPQVLKRARRRWHPDKVAHLNNPSITSEYTLAFQQLEQAGETVKAYLDGSYHAGDAFAGASKTEYKEPEEVIRQNAPGMQAKLRSLWAAIKANAFKKTTEKVQLSDGFKLKDLLDEDLKDDIAFLSMVSFVFGTVFFALLVAIAGSSSHGLGVALSIVLLIFWLACILGAAPLSRFWLPAPVTTVVVALVNFGLRIFRLVAPDPSKEQPGWLVFLVSLPVILARLVKWVVIWPLFQIAKVTVGDKVVGVVFQNVDYYAGAAEWYVDELLVKDPGDMTDEELFHLSHLYSEFTDFQS